MQRAWFVEKDGLGKLLPRSEMLQRRMCFPLWLAIMVAGIAPTIAGAASDSDSKLTYDRPATRWTEALPLGNGRIGAMVFGGIEEERLHLSFAPER
jgi:alpha-L-fucosidase 2